MENAAQTAAANMLRPIIVDVFATLEDGVVNFDHEWRFENDPAAHKGTIEVPPGHKGTPPATIQFHLHDDTGLHLQFVRPTRDAMWVSKTNTCPVIAGNGGQISYKHPWNPNILQVVDANSGPECRLYYILRFNGDAHTDPDGKERPPYVYDPDIKNGGGTTQLVQLSLTTIALAVGAAALALIAVTLWLK